MSDVFLKIYRGTCAEIFLIETVFGHVRQLVDSLPYKEEVRGSSPFVPTSSSIENVELKVENVGNRLNFPFSILNFQL